MHHETMAQITALFRRDDLPERHLHLLRFLDAVHKADLVAQADAVGVGDDGGLPNTSPMIRFALLRPTPGSASSSSKVVGTLQSYLSRSIRIQAEMSRALLRPSPQGLTMASMSSGSAPASAATDGYFANRSCTTIFTRRRYTGPPAGRSPAAARRGRSPACSLRRDTPP